MAAAPAVFPQNAPQWQPSNRTLFQRQPTRTYGNPDMPEDLFRTDRDMSLNEGGDLQNSYGSDSDYYGNLAENDYRPQMNQAYGNLAQTPGYTSDEAASITREPQFNQGVTSDADYQSLYATPQEAAQAKGDPNSLYNYFTPQDQAGMDQIANTSATNQRNIVGSTGADLASGTQQQQQDYGNAIDSNALGQSADYRSQLNGAIDPNQLNLSSNFANDYEMTPQQQEAMVGQAGRTAGNESRAQEDQIYRNAAASGNANPLAVAAATDRARRTGAINSADAMTNARIAASNMAAGRIKDTEDMRLGAANNYAGLKSNALTQEEQNRQQAQQYITGQKMDAATQLGNQRQANAQYTGNLGTGVEQNAAATQLGNKQYQTNTGTGIAQNVQNANTNYGQFMLQNRQNIGQNNQQSKFNQNFQTQQQLSGANQNVANARIGGQREYRGWLTDQTGQAVGAHQNAQQGQLGAYQAKQGLANQAVSGLAGYKANKPTAFDKTMQAIGTFI